MRLETGNLPYDGFEQLMETSHEYPLDLEYSLPDYCADIQKILKCIVTPEVSSAAVLGDSLTVDGTADIRVLYLDAKGTTVRGFDTKKEFTWTVRVTGGAEGAAAVVRPCVQHTNCRAVNARRVDMHITLGFAVSVAAARRTDLTESITHESVETRAQSVDVTCAAGMFHHTFILEENAELQAGRPPIETVLRRAVQWKIDGVQVSEGQATVSGKACLEILYRPFSDELPPEKFLAEISFCEVVDCAGVDEAVSADVSVVSGECIVQPREDSVGEYTIFNIYLKPCLRLRFTRAGSVRTVFDAYATEGVLSVKYKPVTLEREMTQPPRRIAVKGNLSVPENDLERVVDLWCDGFAVSAFSEQESVSIRGKFTACLLYQNRDGRYGYTERLMDFNEAHPAQEDEKYSVSGGIAITRFSILDAGTVECTADVVVSERVRAVSAIRTVESAELDTGAACPGCAAAVYYASKGENIWDIAKRYSARVSAVKYHNDCTEDVLSEDRPMIICRK